MYMLYGSVLHLGCSQSSFWAAPNERFHSEQFFTLLNQSHTLSNQPNHACSEDSFYIGGVYTTTLLGENEEISLRFSLPFTTKQ